MATKSGFCLENGGYSVNIINEKHMKCPYENECKSKYGYCHRWKVEDTTLVDGKLITTKIIYDCNKSLIKV